MCIYTNLVGLAVAIHYVLCSANNRRHMERRRYWILLGRTDRTRLSGDSVQADNFDA